MYHKSFERERETLQFLCTRGYHCLSSGHGTGLNHSSGSPADHPRCRLPLSNNHPLPFLACIHLNLNPSLRHRRTNPYSLLHFIPRYLRFSIFPFCFLRVRCCCSFSFPLPDPRRSFFTLLSHFSSLSPSTSSFIRLYHFLLFLVPGSSPSPALLEQTWCLSQTSERSSSCGCGLSFP